MTTHPIEHYRHDTTGIRLDAEALTAAHIAVEDELVDLRDRRISVIGPANGFVVREFDGVMSPIMRMGTRAGLDTAIRAYLAHLEADARRYREHQPAPVEPMSPLGALAALAQEFDRRASHLGGDLEAVAVAWRQAAADCRANYHACGGDA